MFMLVRRVILVVSFVFCGFLFFLTSAVSFHNCLYLFSNQCSKSSTWLIGYIFSVMLLFLNFYSQVSCFVMRLNLLRASTFNFERSDILRDSIRHSNKKLLSFEFAQSLGIQFRASRYITGLNQTSE